MCGAWTIRRRIKSKSDYRKPRPLKFRALQFRSLHDGALLFCLGMMTAVMMAVQLPAQAGSTFTVTATGRIIGIPSTNDSFDSSVYIGVPYTLSFTWDRAIAPSTSTAVRTYWDSTDTTTGPTITVGDAMVTPAKGTSFVAYKNHIGVSNVPGTVGPRAYTNILEYDAYDPTGIGLAPGAKMEQVSLSLQNSLNPPLLNLTDPGADWRDPFTDDFMYIIYTPPSSSTAFNLTGSVNSVTISPLPSPEPSPLLALGLGMLTLGAGHFRLRTFAAGRAA